MKDIKGAERIVRYRPKFGRLPTEILAQIFDDLTIWSLLSLKLTSFMHLILLRKNFLKKEENFHTRRDRLFKPDQIGLFKLSWKNLLLRENVQPVLKRDMKQGVLDIAEIRKSFLDFSDELYYRCTKGFTHFSMTKLSNALRADCPKQVLECTPFAKILQFIDIDIDRQDNEKLAQAFRLANDREDFRMGHFAFLMLLPYVMRAGATSCFEWSVRILGCVSIESKQSLSALTACMNFDITSLILSSRIPYFMECYFNLLTSVYPAGHDEIVNIIEKYGEKNQLASIKNCLPILSKAHLKALAKTAHETGSESLAALFQNIAASNRLLAQPKSILITRLGSLLVFLQDNPEPPDINDFRSKKMLLEIALEELDHGLSDWAAVTNNQKKAESNLSFRIP